MESLFLTVIFILLVLSLVIDMLAFLVTLSSGFARFVSRRGTGNTAADVDLIRLAAIPSP